MVFKAAAMILFFCALPGLSWAASVSFDQEVSDSLLKKDWPNLVLLLKPKEGQNFDHDLTLAKAYLSLERRAEAIALLKKLNDPRARPLFELSLTQFFSQETSNLYFEAVSFISQLRWAEAKERLDQANSKEPGHGWVLMRLIQVHLALNAKAALLDDSKLAIEEGIPFPEYKVFSGKILLLNLENEDEDAASDHDSAALKIFANAKDWTLKYELPFTWYLEALARNNRVSEINGLATRMLKDHPTWSSALIWFVQRNRATAKLSEKLSEKHEKEFIAQLKLNLKDRGEYERRLEAEAKPAQYYFLNPQSFDLVQASLLKYVQ